MTQNRFSEKNWLPDTPLTHVHIRFKPYWLCIEHIAKPTNFPAATPNKLGPWQMWHSENLLQTIWSYLCFLCFPSGDDLFYKEKTIPSGYRWYKYGSRNTQLTDIPLASVLTRFILHWAWIHHNIPYWTKITVMDSSGYIYWHNYDTLVISR